MLLHFRVLAGGNSSSASDTTPDAFSFTDQTNVELSTVITSNSVTITGINASATVTITGGEHNIAGAGWSSASSSVSNGQAIQVRHTSSGSNSTAVNTVLTVGGISDTFTSTTESAGTGTMVITGSGFGTNANYAPLRFLDFIGKTEGANHIAAGFDDMDTSESDATFSVTNTDGLSIGGGCWQATWDHEGSAGQPEMFGHETFDIAETDTLTMFLHRKIVLDSAMQNGSQLKQGRFLYDDSVGITEYTQASSVKGSLWFFDGTNQDYFQGLYSKGDSSGEFNVTGTGNEDGAGFPDQRNQQWQGMFLQGKMNSANGVLDGVYRNWISGVYTHNRTDMDYRDDSTRKWKRVQPFPGYANAMGDADLTIRHARIVLIPSLAWAAIGNASTFSACTDLLVLEPTAWSNTEITANIHGTRPSGYDWVYVMKTDGTLVSSSGSTSFIEN